MVKRTLRTAFCKTQQRHAHPTFVTLQMLGLKREVESSKRLKIRVSVVRFRPRPPDPHRKCESAYGVSLLCYPSRAICAAAESRCADRASMQT